MSDMNISLYFHLSIHMSGGIDVDVGRLGMHAGR